MAAAPVALAGVTAEFVNRGTPSDGVTTAVGYTGWVIHLVSDSGNISAADVSTTGGILARMVQRWTSSLNDGVYDTRSAVNVAQNVTPSVYNFDSHLLRGPPPFGPPVVPIEDNSIGTGITGFPPNDNVAGYGFGTYIRGAFGVPGPDQRPVLDLAYIVVRDSYTGPDFGTAVAATPGGTFVVPLILPEPDAIALLGAGAWGGALRLRRRRQATQRRGLAQVLLLMGDNEP
jgi:hypothetical protein